MLTPKQCNTAFNANNKGRLTLAAQAACYHAHVFGNISPILNVFENKASLANGAKLVAYFKEHAPVAYDKKLKKVVYIADKADRDLTEEGALDLPDVFAKIVREVKFTVSNFSTKTERLELATKEQVTAELAAVQAYLKEVEATFTDLI